MNHVLARTGFSPPGVIFPISAPTSAQNDEVLESFSSRLAKHIDRHWTVGATATEREIVVDKDNGDLTARVRTR